MYHRMNTSVKSIANNRVCAKLGEVPPDILIVRKTGKLNEIDTYHLDFGVL